MIDFNKIYNPIQFSNGYDVQLSRLVDWIENESDRGVDLDPPYQRGRVWSLRQKQKFVGHLLSGGIVQPVILNEHGASYVGRYEVIDGKQRILALMGWLKGDFGTELPDYPGLIWRTDFPEKFHFRHLGLKVGIVSKTPIEAAKLYLRLNSGGTPHTEAELDKVREYLAGISK